MGNLQKQEKHHFSAKRVQLPTICMFGTEMDQNSSCQVGVRVVSFPVHFGGKMDQKMH